MIAKIIYSVRADRIGPDFPFTHFFLYFKSTMNILCKIKFKAFGDGAEIRPHVFVSGCKNISIGARTVIRPASFIYAAPVSLENVGGINIESDVLIGNNCHIYASNHIFDDISVPINQQGNKMYPSINIAKGVWIGSNVVVLPGVSIGNNSVIGAGSVVTKNVPPNCLYVGNPAKFVRKLNV